MERKYRPGAERTKALDGVFTGAKVGLLTNYTAINRGFVTTAGILKERYALAKLFAPEHGLYGVAQAGEEIGDETDSVTGLPVISLYGAGAEDPARIAGIDVMAFDIQDLGLRFYTYISVMTRAMKLCRAAGIPFIVLDRYDPLGLAKRGGTMLDKAFSSFVGVCSVPSRYGLTAGEFARFANDAMEIGCDLTVIPCEGLTRRDSFRSLGLDWMHPSPNIPTYECALAYAGTVLFEGTNVSEGRGTAKPFEMIGAPWIDGEALAAEMNGSGIAGAAACPVRFRPVCSKYRDEVCSGIRIFVTDEEAFEPCGYGVRLLDTIRRIYPECRTTPFLHKLMGTDAFDRPGFDAEAFLEEEREKTDLFGEQVKPYLLYT